ncbi:hypothetical protein DFR56_1284 [Pseudogracilibacillus auburnensis]|uniref:Uncharacterized protein n=1 Tax=Pseudogracilibacillus auburnensis TaxID=1494959 RepID=A0A2V3VHT5_9BACI|nr:hypothetical protein DFR56_1284 [Pseudogracilibacillus auburnensis]
MRNLNIKILLKQIKSVKVDCKNIKEHLGTFTVIENGRAVNDGKNIDHEVGESLFKIAQENGISRYGLY